MSLASEIKSFAKWTAIVGILDFGLALIVFGLMARQNACSPRMIQTLMIPGYFFAFVGSLSAGIAGLTSVVARVINWRRVRTLRQERERLLADLSALERIAPREIGVTNRAHGTPP